MYLECAPDAPFSRRSRVTALAFPHLTHLSRASVADPASQRAALRIAIDLGILTRTFALSSTTSAALTFPRQNNHPGVPTISSHDHRHPCNPNARHRRERVGQLLVPRSSVSRPCATCPSVSGRSHPLRVRQRSAKRPGRQPMRRHPARAVPCSEQVCVCLSNVPCSTATGLLPSPNVVAAVRVPPHTHTPVHLHTPQKHARPRPLVVLPAGGPSVPLGPRDRSSGAVRLRPPA